MRYCKKLKANRTEKAMLKVNVCNAVVKVETWEELQLQLYSGKIKTKKRMKQNKTKSRKQKQYFRPFI